MSAQITQERLKELVSYNKKTGAFTWIIRRNGCGLGKVAGTIMKRGYVKIMVDGAQYLGHRLAWLYVYGHMPPSLDHRNCNKSDNRISNLRPATQSQNCANIPGRGQRLKGCRFRRVTGKWEATLCGVHLGTFRSEMEASAAYAMAARAKYGEFARII